APFLRFFVGAHAGRKHGFAVGEVVAGRVKSIAEGTIAVDLFGKAIAYADEFEPREVPLPLPEPPRDATVEAAAPASETVATEASGEAAPGIEAPVAELAAVVPVESSATETPEHGAAPSEAELGAAEAVVASDVVEPSSPGDADAAAVEADAD